MEKLKEIESTVSSGIQEKVEYLEKQFQSLKEAFTVREEVRDQMLRTKI